MTTSNAVNLDALLEKRREVLGEKDKFEVSFADKSWWFTAPELASADWNDRFNYYAEDLREGTIGLSDAREELLELLLGDAAEEFAATCDKTGIDPYTVANMAMSEYRENQAKNRSRPNSQRTPKRAKRR